MRKLVLAATVLVTLLALGGCKRTSSKLEGRWKGVRAEGVPDTVLASATSFATNSEIVAQGNQITFNTPGARLPPATFTVEKDDATGLLIRTDRDNSLETFTFSPKADELVWKVDARRSITFKRAN